METLRLERSVASVHKKMQFRSRKIGQSDPPPLQAIIYKMSELSLIRSLFRISTNLGRRVGASWSHRQAGPGRDFAVAAAAAAVASCLAILRLQAAPSGPH